MEVIVEPCPPGLVTLSLSDAWSENHIGDQNINADINNPDIYEDSALNKPGV